MGQTDDILLHLADGSQLTLPTTGPVQVNVVSEFEVGLKVGPATYDQREHAFFQVFHDFSGGIGHRFLDIREMQGVFWDTVTAYQEVDGDVVTVSLGVQPLDTRRTRHLTLPPYSSYISPSDQPTYYYVGTDKHFPSWPWCRHDDGTWLVGHNGGIFKTDANLTQFNLQHDITGGGSSVQVQALIRTAASADACYLAAVWGSSGQRYLKSANGQVWSNGDTDHDLLDLIWWDNKVLAVESNTIIYGVIDSAGAETWNVDGTSDPQPVVTVPGAFYGSDTQLRFIGIAEGPTGEQVVYFTDGRQVYWLDFFARRYYPIDIGTPTLPITGACVWEGNVVWSDGWEVWSYAPRSGTLKEMGLPKRSGVPPSLRLNDVKSRILGLVPAGQMLFAFTQSGTAHQTVPLVWNGTGWHFFTAGSFYGSVGFLAAPATADGATRRLFAFATNGTTTRFPYWDIPSTGFTPDVGVDSFYKQGGIISSWLDGGFNDLFGTLYRLDIDAIGLTTTEIVRAYYQLDNDETTWHSMVDEDGNPYGAFNSSRRSLYFGTTNPGRGLKFRTVRFIFLMERGSDVTLSPEVKAFTLVYNKTPEHRSRFTVQVDVNRMLESAAQYQIDGADATVEGLYTALSSLWTNTHRSVRMVIPSLVPDGVNVKTQDMPMALDDFRSEIAGRGTLTLTFLEPVPSIDDSGIGSSDVVSFS